MLFILSLSSLSSDFVLNSIHSVLHIGPKIPLAPKPINSARCNSLFSTFIVTNNVALTTPARLTPSELCVTLIMQLELETDGDSR